MFIEKNSGHLVFTGSLAGYRGLPGALGYGSSKAAIANLSETFALRPKGYINQSSIDQPGFHKNAINRQK
jgi:NADP-dependent 3-hydroxy acid dehydrogenase YdfG